MDTPAKPAVLGNVLVATDFSHGDALARALLLRLTPGASLTLLHVLPPDVPAPLDRAFRRSAEKLLDELAAGAAASLRAAGQEDVTVRQAVALGKPVAAICEEAARAHAELVVVGRLAAGRAAEAKIGATAERVARACGTPVLVVAGAPRGPYHSPLVGVDGREPTRRIVEMALRVAGDELRTVTLVHAFDVPERTLFGYVNLSNEELADLTEEYALRARPHVRDILPTLPAARVGYSAHVVAGDPRRVLPREAARRGADFVAVGTHDEGALMRLLLGSVSESVLRTATVDVLIVR